MTTALGGKWTRKTWGGWALATVFALGIAGFALMLVSNEAWMISHPVIAHHLAERPQAIYMHFVFGPIALAMGIFQMLPWVRARALLHRWLGRVYVLSCLVSALGGIWLATYSISGTMGQSGFGLLGIFWFSFTLRAYNDARAGDYAAHRRWMIRSYALTFAAVTLRLQLGYVAGMQFDMGTYYPVIAWTCWVPNLIAAEWWLRRDARQKA